MKLFIGLAFIAAVSGVVYAISGDTGYALIGAVAALIVLPPSYDPAIIWKEWLGSEGKPSAIPTCYGDYPFMYPVEAAERDCAHCSHAYGCHEDSPDPRTNR